MPRTGVMWFVLRLACTVHAQSRGCLRRLTTAGSSGCCPCHSVQLLTKHPGAHMSLSVTLIECALRT